MGYYVRVFCKADVKPAIADVLEHINSLNYDFHAATYLTDEELASNEWKNFELHYKMNKLPILVECNNLNDADGLAKEEIEEFIEEIGNPGAFALKTKKVIQHLKETNYIIVSQLPVSDMDEDGYDANATFLHYFVENYEGMIQEDGGDFRWTWS